MVVQQTVLGANRDALGVEQQSHAAAAKLWILHHDALQTDGLVAELCPGNALRPQLRVIGAPVADSDQRRSQQKEDQVEPAVTGERIDTSGRRNGEQGHQNRCNSDYPQFDICQ